MTHKYIVSIKIISPELRIYLIQVFQPISATPTSHIYMFYIFYLHGVFIIMYKLRIDAWKYKRLEYPTVVLYLRKLETIT